MNAEPRVPILCFCVCVCVCETVKKKSGSVWTAVRGFCFCTCGLWGQRRPGHYQIPAAYTRVKGDVCTTRLGDAFEFQLDLRCERWRCRLQKMGRCLAFRLHVVERLYTEKNGHSEVVHDVHRRHPHDLVVFATAVLRIPH